MRDLEKEIAFVTGAASGMGRAIAIDLATSGAQVWGIDTDAAGLASLESEAQKLGIEIRTDQCDVSILEQVKTSFLAMQEIFGGNTILVTAAGIGLYTDFLEMTDGQMRKVIDVNFIGSIYCAQESIPLMKSKGGGKIVFVSSVQAELSLKGCVVYAAQKAALNSAARTLVLEVGEHNIRVNSVSPGTIDTPMLKRDLAVISTEAAAEFLKNVEEANVIGTIGTPQEVADLVHYLVSDRSTYITGTDIIVDGGFRLLKKF